MKDNEFKKLGPLTDKTNSFIDDLHKSGALDALLNELKSVTNQLPESYSVSIDFQLNVCDSNKETSVPLLQTGFVAGKGIELYRHYGDTATQKYLVDGEMCIIPDDYCPHCWEEWDLKFMNPTCPYCDYRLGKEIKYLLDDNTCPWCQEGKVSIDNPTCDNCGKKIDGDMIAWG
ncbi:hypothetical protein SMSP2_01530 [Limihaloglobus sulfuriphilus]|uniref:Double zinc ribbon n=1 Tax=Limihaloglobus sulfuriphilus TaxID=1851148 RepID=A0A1Q2MET4_9BACT|nr:hypothetical protein [Limihaloglobus sulfuriphilus]AQQ71164.1 hypothetical protein SMSP2_01530 [Limihaloglobus sulfuriphilus]